MTAAVVLYAGARASHHRLPALLTELATLPNPVTAHVLHGGLDPATVDAVMAADPDVVLLPAEVEHYAQFDVDEVQRQRLRALDAVRLAGFERVLVAPATSGVVDLLAPALTSPLTAAPGPDWTSALDRPDHRILLLPGARCGPAPLARVDLALAEHDPEVRAAPWSVLHDLGAWARPAPVDDDGRAPAAPVPDVSDALRRARAASADTEFEQARAILAEAYPRAGAHAAEVLLELARALAALSDEAGARAVLGLVLDRHPDDHATVATARTQLAELAWVTHDRATGEQHALAALRAHPAHRRATVLRDRCRIAPDAPTPGALAHVAFYPDRGGNVGDVVLPGAVRAAVRAAAVAAARDEPRWVGVHAHQVFDRERLGDVRGVVVGGGGLFLPDTAPNGRSGWQWNVATADLAALDVPLAVVGVGFNLFPGQAFTGSRFVESLTTLVERAAVVGLRNHGSVRQVQQLLPDELAAKVTWLPCPTTVLADLQPAPPAPVEPGPVLLNAAYDRAARRFGDGYDGLLAGLADWVRALQADGVEVRCAAHLPSDERIAEDLRAAHGVRIGIDALYELDEVDVLARYAAASLVVGMRGHATMIPFGLGTPVLSLVSHAKMRYFLDDIDRPEWGFDVGDPDLGPALLERTRDVLARAAEYRTEVTALRAPLLAAVQAPLRGFVELVGASA